MPLYRLVKQEYIPSDVDEAEFEVSVDGPEGTSLAAMDEAMQAIEREMRAVRGVRRVLATAGGGFLGGVNQGERLRAHRAARGAHVLARAALATSAPAGDPLARLPRQLQPARRDAARSAQRLRKFRDLRMQRAQHPVFNIGGGNFDIDFVAARARSSTTLAELRRAAARSASQELGGIVDADTTLKLDKPELRVEIDRERAADLGVRHRSDIAHARCG